MADISDVELALAQLITNTCYPGGPGTPCAVPGVNEINVFPGWPDANSENAAIKAGVVNITVFPASGVVRNVTRYISQDWHELSDATPTLTATVNGQSVTYGGTGGNGQITGVQIGVQAYSIDAALAPADVATALAALIQGSSATGAVLTVPGSIVPIARVGAPITLYQETRRQKQEIRVTVWCSSPQIRSVVAGFVDEALAVFDEDFIDLPDGTAGILRYAGDDVDDVGQKSGIYRRTLRYSVEYPTIQTQVVSPILWPSATVTRG